MRERVQHTPEVTYEMPHIHESGGLGMHGWQTLIELRKGSDNKQVERILKYGKAVIDGKLQDTQFVHREYLHVNDWYSIWNTARIARLHRELSESHTKSPFVVTKESGMQLYAYLEAQRGYTVEDHGKETKTYRESSDLVSIGDTKTMWQPVFFTLPHVTESAKESIAHHLQDSYASHFDGVKPYVVWRGAQAYIFPSGDFPLPEDGKLFLEGTYFNRNELPERAPIRSPLQEIPNSSKPEE